MSHNNVPELPEEVLTLADDIRTELLDPKFIRYAHGSATAFYANCKGPLCMRFSREWHRARYARRRTEAGKKYEESNIRKDKRNDEFDSAMMIAEKHSRVIEIYVRLTDLYNEMDEALKQVG